MGIINKKLKIFFITHKRPSIGVWFGEKVVTKDISVDELYKALGKQVRTIPQIVMNDKHIGGYNELKEHFINEGKINFKGEKI